MNYGITLILIFAVLLSCSNTTSSDKIENLSEDKVSKTVKEIPQPEKLIPHEIALYKKVSDIPVPNGYKRVKLDSSSFGRYLRNLTLKTENNTLYIYDGTECWDQDVHFAIINMDVGTRDLQQCADAVMRLRAEYLFNQQRYSEIHFNFLSDNKPRYYTKYAGTDRSYKKFRKYMDYIFSYANTGSLKKELKSVNNIDDLMCGDVFIQSGNPYGHAVTVVDVAEDIKTGKKIFMVCQSFMPAQEIHILKNYLENELSPWFMLEEGLELNLPSWTFDNKDLKRF